MAAAMATMATLHAKCLGPINQQKPAFTKPTSHLSLPNLPKGLTTSTKLSLPSGPVTAGAMAAAIFSTLSNADAAFAAQQIADIAEGDNRGIALLIPIIPAIAWVLYNILQPALNQLNRMRSQQGILVALGIGSGTAAAGFLSAPSASASEIVMLAEANSNDNRGLLLLFVVAPAIAWVLYNILQPALNQINRMRSG